MNLSSFQDWVNSVGEVDKSSLSLIKNGRLDVLQDFTVRKGNELILILNDITNSNEFISLSDSDKADLVRNILGDGSLIGFDVSSTLTYEALNHTLKKKGYAFNSDIADRPDDRLKGVVAGSLAWMIDKSDIQAGANVLKSGLPQILKSGVRNTIVKTSHKVKANTGGFLYGERVVKGSHPCKFCKQFAGRKYKLTDSMEAVHFHDHCDCYLLVI